MLKTEIICETCNSEFIIVSQEQEPEYCPFCQTALETVDDGED